MNVAFACTMSYELTNLLEGDMSAIFNSERLMRDGVGSCKDDTDDTDGISDVVAAGGVVTNEDEDGDDDDDDAGENFRFLFLSFRTAVRWINKIIHTCNTGVIYR